MSVVRSRGTALRPVVEHHHLGIFVKQVEYLAIIAQYALRLMPQRRYSEMSREYGEGIDEQFKMLVYYLLCLFLGAVGLAQEARSLGYRLLVNAGTRGCYPCRIPLHVDGNGIANKFASLHSLQLLVSVTGVVPRLHLPVEESHERTVNHYVSLALKHPLPC